MKKFLIAAALLVATVGCTDAAQSAYASYGEEASVKCYSGSEVIFDDTSTGKVVASDSGAGVFFRSKSTGKFVRAYADCIITN